MSEREKGGEGQGKRLLTRGKPRRGEPCSPRAVLPFGAVSTCQLVTNWALKWRTSAKVYVRSSISVTRMVVKYEHNTNAKRVFMKLVVVVSYESTISGEKDVVKQISRLGGLVTQILGSLGLGRREHANA